MGTAVATTNGAHHHAIEEWNGERLDLLKRTICKGATDDEFRLFVAQCQRTGLDPFARQIHAVKRWDSTQQREVMTIQMGIDGFRLIAERTGKYAGNDDPAYDTEDADHPNKATVTVWKLVAGQRVPFTRSARWKEFVQTKKDGSVTKFWKQMPYLMLGKVAEALALRAAFPQELSGLYTEDEMGQATVVEAEVVSSSPPRQQIASRPSAEPCITKEQGAELQGLIRELKELGGASPAQVFESLGISKLSQLSAAKFEDVKASLLADIAEAHQPAEEVAG